MSQKQTLHEMNIKISVDPNSELLHELLSLPFC